MRVRGSLLAAAAALGSAALLGGALAFQYLGGLAPCSMCIWQRWPHVAAIAIGALAMATGWRWTTLTGAAAALVAAVLGTWHAGVEQGLLSGPSACTGSGVGALSTEDLMARIMSAPIIRCDEIAWDLHGVSLAGWNALFSLVLVAVWLSAFRRAA